jgi:hypothetical protein
MVAASLAAQLSVVLAPELMVAGLAPNEEIAGTEPPGIFDGLPKPAQPLKPSDTRKSNDSPR